MLLPLASTHGKYKSYNKARMSMKYTDKRRGVQIKTLLYNFKRTQCDVQCFWDLQNVDTSEN